MARVAILRFPGTWSDRDFAHALSLAGAETEILWHEDVRLDGFDAAIVPGGFAYGDYVRAGAIARLSPAIRELRRFADAGKPVLGSCNGFQILCEAGMLPGALTRNAGLEFRCDWVSMRIESDATPFTRGLGGEVVRMPIAHGEGCWVAGEGTVERVEAEGLVVFRYVDERGAATAAGNPNGSMNNVAGLRNAAGNVVGLMPHPERCAEPLLGGTDGMRLLDRLVASLGTSPASVGA
ncbi:MAG: phosphoribosylformylglycinamidine synthase I [Chloroflexota bacterium]|nr:phosphoribosylformylglycinamidine synthase I [Chloroflexota bacterium]MDE3102464.1 phosphoribosylformylglycinamidine synthase I [Chloroflexota bacterium]